jgi:hypothetical protein
MSQKHNFLINTLLVSIISGLATYFIHGFGWVSPLGYAITFSTIILGILIFSFINKINLKPGILSFTLGFTLLSVIGSLIIRTEQSFLVWFILFLLTGFTYSLVTKKFESNFIIRNFLGSFIHILLKVKALKIYLSELNVNKARFGEVKAQDFLLTIILFGVLGLPVLIIVFSLLLSVNPMFLNISIEWSGYIVFFGFIFAYLITELYLLKVIPHNSKILSGKIKFTVNGSKIILRTVFILLIFLNIFYLFFVGSDISGEITNVETHFRTTNYESYSKYSTSRFWALIYVLIINLLIIYISAKPFSKLSNENSSFLRPAFLFNISLMILMTFGLIASTISRLNLYIGGYGLTSDRVYGYTFTVLMGIVLILFTVGIYIKKYKKLQLISFCAVIFYFAIMHILPIHYINSVMNYELYKAGNIKVFTKDDILSTDLFNDSNSLECNASPIYLASEGSKSEKILAANYILADKESNILTELEKNCLSQINEKFKSDLQKKHWYEFNLMDYLAKNY